MTPTADSGSHFTVRVVNMPPTEIVCNCGKRWVGGDVIAKQKAHMDALNDSSPNEQIGGRQ